MKSNYFLLILLLANSWILLPSGVAGDAKTSVDVKTSNELFPGVKKVSDDLYVGKVAEGFYVAMERVDNNNIERWENYATSQKKKNVGTLKYRPDKVGVSSFIEVLQKYWGWKHNNINNELWIAYASDIPVAKKATLETEENAKNPHIEMFFTVVTSPDAFLTSHMGISRTWEAALDMETAGSARIKQADQSMHLHSFAAKVMKMRDPKKIYMLTPPATIMREIILKKMPSNSVFVGDSLYQAQLEQAAKDPKILLSYIDLEKDSDETVQDYDARVKRQTQEAYNSSDIKDKIPLLKSNPPRMIRIKDKKNQKFTILYPDGKPLVTFDQSSPAYHWIFTQTYGDFGLRLPYVLIDLGKLAQFGSLLTEPASSSNK